MLRIDFRNGVVALAVVALLCAHDRAGAEPEHPKDAAHSGAGVAALVEGKAITIAEVDAIALGKNMKLAQTVYDARSTALNQIIMQRLLSQEAADAGITAEAMLTKRLADEAAPVTDEEVEAFFNANSARMRGQKLEAVSAQIRQFLASQRTAEARKNLLAKLKQDKDIRLKLDPPRAEVLVAADARMMGPADAKITIVEFSDFQ